MFPTCLEGVYHSLHLPLAVFGIRALRPLPSTGMQLLRPASIGARRLQLLSKTEILWQHWHNPMLLKLRQGHLQGDVITTLSRR